MGAFRNSGQVCSLKTRVLVLASALPRARRAAWTACRRRCRWATRTTPPTQIGPLVGRAAARRGSRATSQSAVDEGARRSSAAGAPRARPWAGTSSRPSSPASTPTCAIAQEEIFGPVVWSSPTTTRTRRSRIANDSSYGLNGAVFTTDLEHGVEVASRHATGIVELNGSPIGLGAPIGGVKGSGIGRENGPEGLEAYIEYKAIGITPDLARRWEAALPRGGPAAEPGTRTVVQSVRLTVV